MSAKKTKKKKEWVDPDDAPELTREWFELAAIYDGGKLIREAREHSPKAAKKLAKAIAKK